MKGKARHLRRSQTDAERKLWSRLRARQIQGLKFRRQQPIGPYIVDFCCFEERLVIELDGSQHATSMKADERRTAFLTQGGFRVLRFWDNEVLLDTDIILQQIAQAVVSRNAS